MAKISFENPATTAYIIPSGRVIAAKQKTRAEIGCLFGSSDSKSKRHIPKAKRTQYSEFSSPDAFQITKFGDIAKANGARKAMFFGIFARRTIAKDSGRVITPNNAPNTFEDVQTEIPRA